MHVPYETEKFYYGFPVYILAYPDETVGVGITTGSSSYSLGQMVMIGCDSTTHAARAIKRSGVCSLNLFGAEAMGLFEYAGTVAGGDKLGDAGLASSDYDGIPVLDGSQMSLLCRVLEATDDGTYTHFRCEITQRLVDSALIDGRGRYRRICGRRSQAHLPIFLGQGRTFWHVRTFLQGVSTPLATPAHNEGRGHPCGIPGLVVCSRQALSLPLCPRTSGSRGSRARGCARPLPQTEAPCRG